MNRFSILAFAGAALAFGQVGAATVEIAASATNAHETVYGIGSTSARGTNLAGMIVTAEFADGTTETNTWQAFDPWTNGGFNGTGLSMSFGWDQFALSAHSLLSSVSLQAAPGNALFDIGNYSSTLAPYPAVDTAGTAIGAPFSITDPDDYAGVIRAEYSGIVNIAGQTAAGDTYTDILIDFSGLDAGGLLGALTFTPGDMDLIAVAGDLTPVQSLAAPLPSSLLLLLSAFGLIAGVRREAIA